MAYLQRLRFPIALNIFHLGYRRKKEQAQTEFYSTGNEQQMPHMHAPSDKGNKIFSDKDYIKVVIIPIAKLFHQ